MSTQPPKVLLDTCAVIWLANRAPMASAALDAIVQAGLAEGVFVSPASAWEIGLLSRPRPNRAALQFLPDPKAWFARFMSGAGVKAAPLTGDIAIESSFLPGDIHADPADRLIIATARHIGAPIVTRDSKIIAYGEAGFVDVIAC